MTHSEQFQEIAAALAKAQAAMENVNKSSVNPHFKSRYADLAAVREATVPHLAANGIAIVQPIIPNSDGMIIRTMLIHSSGQWIASEFPVPRLQRIQELGSYITYARRYSWMGLCGLAPEDDDGNAAANAKQPSPPKPNVMRPAHETGEIETAADRLPPDAAQAGSVSAFPSDADSPAEPAAPFDPMAETEKAGLKAAAQGMTALRTTWENFDPDERRHFRMTKDRVWIPMAKEADRRMAKADPPDFIDPPR